MTSPHPEALDRLADVLRPLEGTFAHLHDLANPANLCVAAAHEIRGLEATVADLRFELDRARGTARGFVPRPSDGGH